MKRSKLLAIALLSMVLVACNKAPEAPEPEVKPVESEVVVESDQKDESEEQKDDNESKEEDEKEDEDKSDEESSSDKKEDEDKEDEDKEASTSSDIVGEKDIPFTINIDGEEVGKFVAKDAVGLSVLEAMESIEELDFVFDEDEGVIDEIDNEANDYALGHTWVYLLNGQMADLGVVSQKLEAGDEIDWYFGAIEDLPVIIIPEDGMPVDDEYDEDYDEDEEDYEYVEPLEDEEDEEDAA